MSVQPRTIILLIILFCQQLKPLANVLNQISFNTDDYPGHSINYDILKSNNGIIYIANAYGILEYNGSTFKQIGLPDGLSPLSLCKSKDGNIYVGGAGQVGKLVSDEKNIVRFESLNNTFNSMDISKHRITKVESTMSGIYFLSEKNIFFQGEGVNSLFYTPSNKASKFTNIFKLNQEGLIAHCSTGELYKVQNDEIEMYGNYEELSNKRFVGVINLANDSSILFFESHSYLLNKGTIKSLDWLNKLLINKEITCVEFIGNSKYAFGTEESGIFIIDFGSKQIIEKIQNSDIGTSAIRNLRFTNNNQLWVAHNGGISLLEVSHEFNYLKSDNSRITGMGLSAIKINQDLFLGTSTGLYSIKGFDLGFRNKIHKKAEAGSWIRTLQNFDDALLFSNGDESGYIKENKISFLTQDYGKSCWIYQQLNDSTVIGATYEGFLIYSRNRGNWFFKNKVLGFDESIRCFEIDSNGVIWAVHGNKGLYRIELDKSLQKINSISNYVEGNRLPPDYFNDIIEYKGELLVSTLDGIKKLENGKIKEDMRFNLLPEITRIKTTNYGDLYTVLKGKPYFIDTEKAAFEIDLSIKTYDISDKMVGSAEFIYMLNDSVYVIGTVHGFVIYKSYYSSQSTTKCFISKVSLNDGKKDSLVGHNISDSIDIGHFSFSLNNISLEFSNNSFGLMKQPIYYTTLKRNGVVIRKDSSLFNIKEYQNLSSGDYILSLVIGDDLGWTSQKTNLKFTILSPWYLSTLAKVSYCLLLLIIMLSTSKLIKQKINKLRKQLEEDKEQSLLEKDTQYEKEKASIILKQKEDELTILALHYTEKKNFIDEIKSEIETLKNQTDLNELNRSIKDIVLKIKLNTKEENDWSDFLTYINEHHNGFLDKIREFDPEISEDNLLLCSYIKTGKSNKEIGNLLNISSSAVLKRKYRLKKSWNLESEQNFNDFIQDL